MVCNIRVEKFVAFFSIYNSRLLTTVSSKEVKIKRCTANQIDACDMDFWSSTLHLPLIIQCVYDCSFTLCKTRPPLTIQTTKTTRWITVHIRCFVTKYLTCNFASGLYRPSTPSSASWDWQGTSLSYSPSSVSSDSRPWQTYICSTCPLLIWFLLSRSPSGQRMAWQNGCWAWCCAKPCTPFTRSASSLACSFFPS